MIQIHNIPVPIQGEYIHSYFTRMAVANGAGTLLDFADCFCEKSNFSGLYGGKKPFAMEDLLLDMIESNSMDITTVRDMYNNMSALSFQSLFITPIASARQIGNLFRKRMPDDFFYHKGTIRPASLHFCPECMQEDLEKYGHIILHTEHQLAGVKTCYKHKIPLGYLTDGFNTYDVSRQLIGETETESDYTYTTFATELYRNNYDNCKPELAETITERISELSIRNADDLEDYLRVKEVLPKLTNQNIKNLLVTMNTKNRANFVPMDIINICIPLFGSADNMILHSDFDSESFESYVHDERYEIIGQTYAHKPIILRCKDCGYEYITTAAAFTFGWRCPQCDTGKSKEDIVRKFIAISGGKDFALAGKVTTATQRIPILHKECGETSMTLLDHFLTADIKCKCQRIMPEKKFLKDAERNSPDILVKEKFRGLNERILCRCKICGHEWNPIAGSILFGHPQCPNIKTHDGYLNPAIADEKIFRMTAQKANPNIKLIGPYTGHSRPIDCECLICGHTWTENRAARLLGNRLCPNFRNHDNYRNPQMQTTEEFIEEASAINDKIRILSEYKGINRKVMCECKICGHRWETKACHLLDGHGCPMVKDHPDYENSLDEETFLKLVAERNPGFEVISKFKGTKEPVIVKCRECGYESEVPAQTMLVPGKGCENFRNHEGYSDSRHRTQEMFVQEAAVASPELEILGEFKGVAKRIEVRCRLCGRKWEPIAGTVLKGLGCSGCRNRLDVVSEKSRKTQEQFVEEVKKAGRTVRILGEYKGLSRHIDCQCEICGYRWSPIASTLIKGSGCPNFTKHPDYVRIRKTHEQFVEEVREINPNIRVLGEYHGIENRIECECKICGHKWTPKALSVKAGTGCPNYRKHPDYVFNNVMRTHEQFVEELKEINNSIRVLGKYQGGKNPIECECKICGHKWSPRANRLLRGHGCPNYRNHPGYKHSNKKQTVKDNN